MFSWQRNEPGMMINYASRVLHLRACAAMLRGRFSPSLSHN